MTTTGSFFPSPTDTLAAIRQYFEDLNADRQQFKDWLGGTVNGGPENDGRYPLTDYTGDVHLVECPAKIVATVELTMGDLVSKVYDTLEDLQLVENAADGQLCAVRDDGFYLFDQTADEWEKVGSFPLINDPDNTFAADSDGRVPTQKAVKSALAAAVAGFTKIAGEIDVSNDPMFPEALQGDIWVVTGDGRIGGVLGKRVSDGSILIALNDNAGGNMTTAGPDWGIMTAGIVEQPPADGQKYVRGANGWEAFNYSVPMGFASHPLSDETLLVHCFAEKVMFPDNWAGSKGYVASPPSGNYTLTLRKVTAAGLDTVIGTVVISGVGVVTFNTTGAEVSFNEGDSLLVVAPPVENPVLANAGITFKGIRT